MGQTKVYLEDSPSAVCYFPCSKYASMLSGRHFSVSGRFLKLVTHCAIEEDLFTLLIDQYDEYRNGSGTVLWM